MSHEIRNVDLSDDNCLTKCFSVFAVLRPHLSEAQFISRVRNQSAEGYKIVYIETQGTVVAAAGYRIANFLAWGKTLYIDDLITDPNMKKQGLAGSLMDWLIKQSEELNCDEVHLDTGFQRHDAHRLYLNKGLSLSCHHLSKSVK